MLNLKKHHGSATIITIMAITILAAVGSFFVTLTSSNMKAVSEFQNAYSAQYAAEAGAKTAIAMFGTDSPNWSVFSAETAVLGFADAYYQVRIIPTLTDAQLPAPGEKYEVTATGKYKKAVKVINFNVTAAEETSPPLISDWR